MSASKLVLGTVQFGMKYGIANMDGKPEIHIVSKIFSTAINEGIKYIDTAQAYGNSEEIIGREIPSEIKSKLKIMTKLSPEIDREVDTVSERELSKKIEASILNSAQLLRQERIYCMMLHRASSIFRQSGVILRTLETLKNNKIIENIGVSIQNPAELNEVISIPSINYIQMPYNILDGRWSNVIPKIIEEKEKRELKIHARSIFLQGLLLNKSPELWSVFKEENYHEIISWIDMMVDLYKRESIADLCIAFVNSSSWIDGLVIGVQNIGQLKENIGLVSNDKFSPSVVDSIMQSRPLINDMYLDPSNWK